MSLIRRVTGRRAARVVDLHGVRVDEAFIREMLWDGLDDRAGQRLFDGSPEELEDAITSSFDKAQDLAALTFPLVVWRGLTISGSESPDLQDADASWSDERAVAEMFAHEGWGDHPMLLRGIIRRAADVDWYMSLRQRVQYDVVEVSGPSESEVRGKVHDIVVVSWP
jgi:hypothetical protein